MIKADLFLVTSDRSKKEKEKGSVPAIVETISSLQMGRRWVGDDIDAFLWF